MYISHLTPHVGANTHATIKMSESAGSHLIEKLDIVNTFIEVLQDTHQALQAERDDIKFLIQELVDLDGKTSRLIMHLKGVTNRLVEEVSDQ